MMQKCILLAAAMAGVAAATGLRARLDPVVPSPGGLRHALTATPATPPNPSNLAVMADVGSGGTRLILYVKSKGEIVECCGKGDPCARECAGDGCSDIDQIEIQSRYGANTTKQQVADFAELLVKASYDKVRAKNKTACVSFLGKNEAEFKTILSKANIVLLATAGARRIEVATPSRYQDVFVAGFQQYFGPAANVRGSVLPG